MTTTAEEVGAVLRNLSDLAGEKDRQAKHHANEAQRLTTEAHELRTLAAQVERLARDTQRGTA